MCVFVGGRCRRSGCSSVSSVSSISSISSISSVSSVSSVSAVLSVSLGHVATHLISMPCVPIRDQSGISLDMDSILRNQLPIGNTVKCQIMFDSLPLPNRPMMIVIMYVVAYIPCCVISMCSPRFPQPHRRFCDSGHPCH